MPDMENRKDIEQQNAAEDIAEDIPAAKPAVKKPAGKAAAEPAKTGAAVKPAGQSSAKKPAAGNAGEAAAAKPVQKGAAAGNAQTNASGQKKPVSRPAANQAVGQTGKPMPKKKPAVAAAPAAADESFEDEPQKSGLAVLSERIRQWKESRPAKKPLSKKAALRRKRRIRKIIRRTVLCIFSALLVVVFGVYMVLFTVFNGPSPTVADLLVNSLLETSALKFVPRLYYTENEVQEIIARNAVIVQEEATDTSMVVIDRTAMATGGEQEQKDIEIVEVNGATYHGYMMIVRDPARMGLAVCDPEFEDDYGKFLDEMAVETGAVAAINAGGFEDEGGSGKGGKPLGIVIKDGEVLNSKTSGACSIVIGFDQEDKLIVGKLTAKEAVALGMRDAASFGPVLVLNGEPAQVKGSSSGLNPRTAIGQRADGAVLLLVIDGRQANSLGASMADLIDVMMQFDAVNAANLDGGSSSKMWYEGEFVNDGVALTGSRRLPTAFIVK